MSDELVRALREYPPHTWPTAQNAADRIEALEAEIEKRDALLREARNDLEHEGYADLPSRIDAVLTR